ncbi:hypothetical protein IWGMT90018_05520 [Mycobacterium kiyosense]|nr:hypothetical protein IWGMT90018_05520 [Mycobacterium kiyosense]
MSAGTWKARWFIVLTALVMSPSPGSAPGELIPGPVGGLGEPEECDAVAVAGVEEEVLTRTPGQIERLDQRHTQDVAVEVHGARHVRTHQGDVVDAAELELGVGVVRLDHRPPPYLRSKPESNIRFRFVGGA